MADDAFQAEVLAMFQAINRRLDAMPALVAGLRAGGPTRLLPAHRAALTASLAKYMDATPNLESRVFSARDLMAGAEVAELLRVVMGDEAGAGAAKRVGKLLARGDGEVHGGIYLQRVSADRSGTIWRASRVPS
jgi:hypothetical protein